VNLDMQRNSWLATGRIRDSTEHRLTASTSALDGSMQGDSGRVSGPPPIAFPKGGGAIRGIGEKFAATR
jgi:hypothetical protein